MKIPIKHFVVGALAATSLLAGCDKTDPFGNPSPTPSPKSMVDLVSSDKNFSRLAQAVTRANLASALGGSNLTLFAPDNGAFAAAGLDSATIAKTDPTALANILKYHVLSTPVRSSDLPVVVNKETPTLNGTAYVSRYDFGTPAIAVNGAHVTLSDITATNGVVHILDRVLMPPAGTIADAINSNANFTFLKAAIARAGLGAALAGAGPLTVFAPTDDAFRATSPYKTIDQVNAADPAALTAILQYHVLSGRVFSTNFVPKAYPVSGAVVVPDSVTTASGRRLYVGGDLKLAGSGNGTDQATITRPNMLYTNGVLHGIDRVLLPK